VTQQILFNDKGQLTKSRDFVVRLSSAQVIKYQ